MQENLTMCDAREMVTATGERVGADPQRTMDVWFHCNRIPAELRRLIAEPGDPQACVDIRYRMDWLTRVLGETHEKIEELHRLIDPDIEPLLYRSSRSLAA